MPTGKPADVSLDDITGPADDLPLSGATPVEDVALDSGVASASQAKYSATPEFDTKDVIMPRLRLAQGQTAEVVAGDAVVGDWVVLGGEPVKECVVIPVTAGKRRARRAFVTGPNGQKVEQVVCQSPDAIRGYGDPGIACEECPFSQWTDGPNGARQRPECPLIYTYQVYSVTHQMPAVFECKGTSENAGRLINTMFVAKGGGNFAVKLGSAPMKSARGAMYQTPTVNYIKTPEGQGEMAKMLLLPTGDTS